MNPCQSNNHSDLDTFTSQIARNTCRQKPTLICGKERIKDLGIHLKDVFPGLIEINSKVGILDFIRERKEIADPDRVLLVVDLLKNSAIFDDNMRYGQQCDDYYTAEAERLVFEELPKVKKCHVVVFTDDPSRISERIGWDMLKLN